MVMSKMKALFIDPYRLRGRVVAGSRDTTSHNIKVNTITSTPSLATGPWFASSLDTIIVPRQVLLNLVFVLQKTAGSTTTEP